jgi:hypothetical protein
VQRPLDEPESEALLLNEFHNWVVAKQGAIGDTLRGVNFAYLLAMHVRAPVGEEPSVMVVSQTMLRYAVMKKRTHVNLAIPVNQRMQNAHFAPIGLARPTISRQNIDIQRARRKTTHPFEHLREQFVSAFLKSKRGVFQKLELNVVGSEVQGFIDGIHHLLPVGDLNQVFEPDLRTRVGTLL